MLASSPPVSEGRSATRLRTEPAASDALSWSGAVGCIAADVRQGLADCCVSATEPIACPAKMKPCLFAPSGAGGARGAVRVAAGGAAHAHAGGTPGGGAGAQRQTGPGRHRRLRRHLPPLAPRGATLDSDPLRTVTLSLKLSQRQVRASLFAGRCQSVRTLGGPSAMVMVRPILAVEQPRRSLQCAGSA